MHAKSAPVECIFLILSAPQLLSLLAETLPHHTLENCTLPDILRQQMVLSMPSMGARILGYIIKKINRGTPSILCTVPYQETRKEGTGTQFP